MQYASYDLAKLDDAQRTKLFAALKKFDSVVLTGPFTDEQVSEIEEAGIRVIDARQVSPDEPSFAVNHGQPSADTVSAVYTGVVPIVYKAQRALLENLMESSFWSFVTITPLLMFVVAERVGRGGGDAAERAARARDFRRHGLARNQHRHRLDDVGQHCARRGGGRHDPLPHLVSQGLESTCATAAWRFARAYRHCAPPTIQAALISGLSLSVFVFSTFTPTQRMGWLMLSILICGHGRRIGHAAGAPGRPARQGVPDSAAAAEENDGEDGEDVPTLATITCRSGQHNRVTASRETPARKEPATAAVRNGETEVTAGHQPHAFTLRERLADIRRAARDGGEQ